MVGFGLSSDFGLGLQRFPRESQSCMTNRRKIGLGILGFPLDGRLQGYVVKKARDLLSYALDVVVVVPT